MSQQAGTETAVTCFAKVTGRLRNQANYTPQEVQSILADDGKEKQVLEIGTGMFTLTPDCLGGTAILTVYRFRLLVS